MLSDDQASCSSDTITLGNRRIVRSEKIGPSGRRSDIRHLEWSYKSPVAYVSMEYNEMS